MGNIYMEVVVSIALVFEATLLSHPAAAALASVQNTSMAAGGPLVPALVAFGDSIVDPGNNNALLTLVKCNFPPYGMDFPMQKPTGRFCNGKIPTDFLASRLGIKEFLPPYLGAHLEPQHILTGVSFGSGATGFDPLTSEIASVLSMQDQLEMFKEFKETMKGIAGEARAATILSESIYLVCAGTNDIANTYFSILPTRSLQYSLSAYIDMNVKLAEDFVEQLANMGARKISFVGLPPIGCLPSQRTLAGGIARQCVSSRNRAALLFNSKMEKVLLNLQTRLAGTKIVFLDIYPLFLDFIQRPGVYGFTEVTKGCCGTGILEASILCNMLTPVTCADDTKYVFWDSFHPTERTYQILVDELFQRYFRFLA